MSLMVKEIGPVTLDEAKILVAEVAHWHHAFEIYPGLVTPGTYDPTFLLDKTQLPADLRGLRVLDIGTCDGFFALQLARRGANVVAIDYRGKRDHGYYVMERLNPVQIEYHRMNVYELSDKDLGQFDIVLFMGVLYHLPDMLRALHLIRRCCRGTLFVETHSENDFCRDIAAARYYRGSTLANDHTNFWAPNRLCVLDMLHDAGFDVERDEAWGLRLFAVAKAVQTQGERSQKMQLGYGWVGSR
ncbi:tRNA (mo5U34)-methyltransferase [Rhizobiales bacterium GAS188]|nr:tRNA (mo5U34)-methyltransferase [Rhizobiales bacterium GAS188]